MGIDVKGGGKVLTAAETLTQTATRGYIAKDVTACVVFNLTDIIRPSI